MDQEEVSKKQVTIIPSKEEGFGLDSAFSAENTDMNEHRDMSLDYYFKSYSHLGIHEEMLKDKHRTLSYMDSVLRNRHLFKDKVVLDIGCGTSILSLFCATAGAKHVYAVDFATITHQAKEIVAENNLSDKITIIRGKIEEITLPVEKVDIIISEWMGYFLLYESMLDSVLYARDKWLVPGGLIFPDRAIMYIAAIEDRKYIEDKMAFWERVYGIDMSPMKSLVLKEAMIDTFNSEHIISKSCPILDINLKTVKVEDLDFVSDFSVKVTRKDHLSAFIVWFDNIFSDCNVPVTLTTSPYEVKTHWKHTFFYLEKSISVGPSEFINGTIAVRKNKKNPRHIDVLVQSRIADKPWEEKGRSNASKVYFIA
jgi:protein arginine N-methyltransferase 1